jgi:SHS2 domain-containing protein
VKQKFEIIEHPADVGFRAYGATLEELFVHAAEALLALACEPEGIEEREQRTVYASGRDLESLLFAWLAEILAAGDAEKMFFRRAEVKELQPPDGNRGGEVRGVVYGERFDRSRHHPGTYIKAVTYHQLRVERTADGWRATVYLDV